MSLAVVVNEACKRFGKPGNPMLLKRMSRLSGKFQSVLDTYLEQQSVLALDHISFVVEPGEIYGLCGPIGSGKSTIIQLLATQLLPDFGKLCVFGYDVVSKPAQVRRLTNKVAADASLLRQMSAVENLLYRVRIDGVNSIVRKQDVEGILIRLGLEPDTIYQPLEKMNRSQQQVVAIATRLLVLPRLLLLDEPFNELTPEMKSRVCDVIKELRCSRGLTVVFTTSLMQDAYLLGDRIAILNNGRIKSMEDVDCQQPVGITEPVESVIASTCYELSVVV